MTKEEKFELVEELSAKLASTDFFYVADTAGLSVNEVNDFRKVCFEKGVEYRVVKNSLIKKALGKLDADYSSFDTALKGSSGILFSPKVGNAPAKVIKEFTKSTGLSKPAFKAASIDSDLFVGAENLDILASLKSKDELLGDIIGLLQSPAKNVISALKSGGSTIAGIIKTLSEKEG